MFGCEFLAMKRAKAAYKLAIKAKERGSQNEFTNSLNDVLLRKDMDSFWRSWKAKFGSNSHPRLLMVAVTIQILQTNLPRCLNLRVSRILTHITTH